MNKSKSKNYLLKKLDDLENSMITAHNKDYERVMADIGYQLTEEEKLKKKKRLQKINSYKEKRKLRQMSELRESYLQERISKVLEKQKKNNSICIKRTLPPIKYIADDVIKSSGYRIGPFEVESALMEHPAVFETAITAVPDEIRGQIVKATIVLAKGFKPSDELKKQLQDHVKKTTAPYKYPRIIEFVDALPKTISGKIKRAELRKKDGSN